jgi:hypothetical protein
MRKGMPSVIATAAATALLAALPATASAATHHVLTTNKVGGPNVAVGATLKAPLKAGTKATSTARAPRPALPAASPPLPPR